MHFATGLNALYNLLCCQIDRIDRIDPLMCAQEGVLHDRMLWVVFQMYQSLQEW